MYIPIKMLEMREDARKIFGHRYEVRVAPNKTGLWTPRIRRSGAFLLDRVREARRIGCNIEALVCIAAAVDEMEGR